MDWVLKIFHKADTVIIESHYGLENQYADFQDGAEAILLANENLYNGKKGTSIERIFKERGIL